MRKKSWGGLSMSVHTHTQILSLLLFTLEFHTRTRNYVVATEPQFHSNWKSCWKIWKLHSWVAKVAQMASFTVITVTLFRVVVTKGGGSSRSTNNTLPYRCNSFSNLKMEWWRWHKLKKVGLTEIFLSCLSTHMSQGLINPSFSLSVRSTIKKVESNVRKIATRNWVALSSHSFATSYA